MSKRLQHRRLPVKFLKTSAKGCFYQLLSIKNITKLNVLQLTKEICNKHIQRGIQNPDKHLRQRFLQK